MALNPNETVTTAKLLKQEVEALWEAVNSGAGTDAISPNILNAKGDIVVASGNDTPTIISVGSNGQVLSADSTTGTGLKWIPAPSGGGSGVSSVNSRTGDVTLTKSDVGLSNADNTSDANKPVSNATQSALNAKANASDLSTHTGNTSNPHNVTKSQVGLGNVDNTSDASKPVSLAVQSALDEKANVDTVTSALAAKADLVDGKVPVEQLPAGGSETAGVQVWEWYIDTASQGAGVLRKYNDSGQTLTIVAVRVRANINPPSGDDLIVDVNKGTDTIFTTQANRPTVEEGTSDSGKVTNMNVTSVADGEYLVPDIDQVGDIVPGSGVLVSVTLR